MHVFEAIDLLELVTVTGGEASGASPTTAPGCVPFTGDPTAPLPPTTLDIAGAGAPPPRGQ